MKTLLNGVINAFSSNNGRTAPRSGFRPGLESLEARECLSVTAATINSGHTLVITGDNAANAVTVLQDDDHDLITVTAPNLNKTFTSSQINAVLVDLKGGNDTFTYQLGGGSDFKFTKNIQTQLGAGNDTAHFDFFNDGQGGEAVIKANLTLSVLDNGVKDAEVVDVTLGKVDDVAVLVKTRLGFGDDTFTGTLKRELVDDANVKFDLVDVNNDFVFFGRVLFRGGNDKYSVHADNDVDIDGGAVLDVNIASGTGDDTVDFAFAGEIDGLLKLRVDGGNWHDNITAVFDIEGDSDGRLDVIVDGMKDADKLTLTVNNNAGDDLHIINAVLNGGSGVDTGVATSNVTKINVEN